MTVSVSLPLFHFQTYACSHAHAPTYRLMYCTRISPPLLPPHPLNPAGCAASPSLFRCSLFSLFWNFLASHYTLGSFQFFSLLIFSVCFNFPVEYLNATITRVYLYKNTHNATHYNLSVIDVEKNVGKMRRCEIAKSNIWKESNVHYAQTSANKPEKSRRIVRVSQHILKHRKKTPAKSRRTRQGTLKHKASHTNDIII